MAWCEANAVDYIFGLPGNAVLSRLLDEAADDVRVRRAEEQVPVLRRYAETPLRRQIMGLQTPGRGQDRGYHAGARHTLRGDQPTRWQRRMAL